MKKILFLFATVFSLNIFAQTYPYVIPNKDFVVNVIANSGLDATGVASAVDYVTGAVYTCGFVNTASAGKDLAIVKFDSTGAQQWISTYDFTSLNDRAKALCVDASGNVYVTGFSESATGNADIVTIKYNSSGTQQWIMRWNGTNNTNDEGNDITLDGSGNVWVVGYATTTSKGKDIQFLKYNSSGTLLNSGKKNGTANGDDIAEKMAISGNSMFLTGTIKNTTTNGDICILCVNTVSATLTWSTAVNGSGNTDDTGLDLAIDNGELFICGKINNTTTGNDYYFARVNQSIGAIKYSNNYDGGFNGSDYATALVPDALGNYAVTGIVSTSSNTEYHTRLYDTSSVKWTHAQTVNAAYTSISPRIATDTIAQHFYVSGTYSNTTLQALLYQLTPTGNKSWTQYHDGNTSAKDAFTDLVLDGIGRIYLPCASETSTTSVYLYQLVRYSQTPYYYPLDSLGEDYSQNFLYFKNKGQLFSTDSTSTAASDVLFYNNMGSPEYFVQSDRISYVFRNDDTLTTTIDSTERIDLKYTGSNLLANVFDFEPTYQYRNYFTAGADSNGIHVTGMERLISPNLYDDIDLHYYSNNYGLKYYFVIKPWAESIPILFTVSGAVTSTVTSNHLILTGKYGIVNVGEIYSYQIDSLGSIKTMTTMVTWNKLTDSTYSFNIPTYNTNLPLIIMIHRAVPSAPTNSSANLNYSTYYGGPANERFNDVKVASNGDRFVTGYTSAQTFPFYNAIYPNFAAGIYDAVLLKYTADDSLRFATFWGGTGQDIANTVTTDTNGDIYFGGQTFSTDMIVNSINGATNQLSNGYWLNTGNNNKADGFIVKFNGTGDSLRWARYLGGSKAETIFSLFIDGSNNLYFSGYTSSNLNFPSVSAYKSTPGTTSNVGNFDATFGKFNSNLVAQWITCWGGNNNGNNSTVQNDWGFDIVTDNSGKVYGCGFTDANDLTLSNGTGNPNVFFDSILGGTSDGFLVRFSSNGTPDYSTFIGGNASDDVSRLVYKTLTGELYFAGNSGSTTGFPWVNKSGAYYSQYAIGTSGQNAFVAYADNSLTKQWCTFYGHHPSKWYYTKGLSVDDLGFVYLSGYTTGSDTLVYSSSTPSGVYTDNTRSGTDGYIAIFDGTKQIHHAHYFGGVNIEQISNSDLYGSTALYITGYTTSNNFPYAYTTNNAALIDSTYNGVEDGFISRFLLNPYNYVNVNEVSVLNNGKLIVYPNPANSNIFVKFNSEKSNVATLRVFNLIGQQILEKQMQNNTTTIDCEVWRCGMYIINIQCEDYNGSVKIIKE